MHGSFRHLGSFRGESFSRDILENRFKIFMRLTPRLKGPAILAQAVSGARNLHVEKAACSELSSESITVTCVLHLLFAVSGERFY
jgi:hypothetical protein